MGRFEGFNFCGNEVQLVDQSDCRIGTDIIAHMAEQNSSGYEDSEIVCKKKSQPKKKVTQTDLNNPRGVNTVIPCGIAAVMGSASGFGADQEVKSTEVKTPSGTIENLNVVEEKPAEIMVEKEYQSRVLNEIHTDSGCNSPEKIANLDQPDIEPKLEESIQTEDIPELHDSDKENSLRPRSASRKSVVSTVSDGQTESDRLESGNEPDLETDSYGENSETEMADKRDKWRKQFRQLWTTGKWVELGLNNSLVDEDHLNNFLEYNLPSESGMLSNYSIV